MGPRLRVAVLDDYQGVSKEPFQALDQTIYEVTTFEDTLLPYNHADTPSEVKDALAARLEPFDIICLSTPPPRLRGC